MITFKLFKKSAPALVLGLVLLSFIFFNEIQSALNVWVASTAYNHCFLILPIVFWLIWDRRYRLDGLQPEPVRWAFIPTAAFAVLWLIANRLGVMEGQQLAAMGIVQLLFLSILGLRVYRALLAPFLYLFFLIPFGGFLVPTLQGFTTKFVADGLNLLGVPNFVTGNTIEISAGVFYVAQACAGLRFLIAAVAFSVLYALLIFRSFWRRILFITLSLFVPVVANGFRALGIVWLGHALGSAKAAATDHILYGYIFFSIVLALLILLGLPFRQDQPVKPSRATVTTQNVWPTAFVRSAIGVVFIAGIGPFFIIQVNHAIAANHIKAPMPFAGCTIISSGPLTSSQQTGGIAEQLLCANKSVAVNLALLPAEINPKIVFDTLRAFSHEDDSKALITTVKIPYIVLSNWQLVTTKDPPRITLSTLFIDGRPMAANLATRFYEAWHSLLDAHHAQLVVAVTSLGTRPKTKLLLEFIKKGPIVPANLIQLTKFSDLH